MLHLPATFIIFDLEFTDVEIATASRTMPEIIEIGAIKVNQRLEVKDSFQSLIRPSRLDTYSDYCERLTGISRDILEAADPFEKVWRYFAEFTDFRKWQICSWGTEVDVALLKQHYVTRGLAYPHHKVPLDAVSFYWAYCSIVGLRPVGWSLKAVCNQFSIERSDTHRALGDSKLVLKLFSKWDDSSEDMALYDLAEV